ncbi:MAG: LLM class flavin-dependent oxidoreductase [Dehalococcoidia bacterium]|nr:LLM class flavin-dependent oxidoreductase [Dehalococcoidia bacterium]
MNQTALKVGVGLGAWPFGERSADALWRFVDRAEALGIDSLWLSDRLVGAGLTLEPLTVLAAVAGRTKRMLFGTSVLVLPLRNPVLLAKELATLDFISGGRCLLAVGVGQEDDKSFDAVGVPLSERGRRADEAIVLMRRLWTEERVTFKGMFYQVTDIALQPKPARESGPPIWIGGRSQAALRRVGRLGDGWLAAQVTPEEYGPAVEAIRVAAREPGRQVPDDHYGVIVNYCVAPTAEEAERLAAPYVARRRSDIPLRSVAGLGPVADVRALLRRYLAAGASKFVLRPVCPPVMVMEQLDILGRDIAPQVEALSYPAQ